VTGDCSVRRLRAGPGHRRPASAFLTRIYLGSDCFTIETEVTPRTDVRCRFGMAPLWCRPTIDDDGSRRCRVRTSDRWCTVDQMPSRTVDGPTIASARQPDPLDGLANEDPLGPDLVERGRTGWSRPGSTARFGPGQARSARWDLGPLPDGDGSPTLPVCGLLVQGFRDDG